MDISRLKYFHAVAKEGGFTKASKVLRIAQPAISKMVRQLEEDLQLKLFDRVGKQVRLTREGGEVLRYCETIFAHALKIENLKKTPLPKVGGSLAFGAVDSIASILLPAALKISLGEAPALSLTVVTSSASHLVEKISSRDLEFGLFFHLPELPPELEVRHKYRVPHKLVISRAVLKSRKVRSTFIGSREVDDTNTRTFPTLRKLQEDIPEASISISANSLTLHKELVLRGAGVSILPLFLVKKELENGKLVPLYPKQKFEWNLKVVVRKDYRNGPNAKYLIGLIEKELHSLLRKPRST